MTDAEYYNDFLIAVGEVDIARYGAERVGSTLKLSERAFAYELYFQWRKFAKIRNYEDDDRRLCGEIWKAPDQQDKKDLLDKDGANIKFIQPDMILHGGVLNFNHQQIAVEIKTKRNIRNQKEFKNLIRKLVLLKKSRLQYCNVVLLLLLGEVQLNREIERQKKFLSQFKDLSFIQVVIKETDHIITRPLIITKPTDRVEKPTHQYIEQAHFFRL